VHTLNARTIRRHCRHRLLSRGVRAAGAATRGRRRAAPGGISGGVLPRRRAPGQPVYEVDPASSRIVIEVRRGGALAQLGHDHVVVSHDVAGYVAPVEARADLYVRLERLVVDEAAERAEAHFESQPPDDAIAGTRENMLRKLDAAAHPFAVIGVRGVDRDPAGARLNATLALTGPRAPSRSRPRSCKHPTA
jgi:hypothetical protein